MIITSMHTINIYEISFDQLVYFQLYYTSAIVIHIYNTYLYFLKYSNFLNTSWGKKF